MFSTSKYAIFDQEPRKCVELFLTNVGIAPGVQWKRSALGPHHCWFQLLFLRIYFAYDFHPPQIMHISGFSGLSFRSTEYMHLVTGLVGDIGQYEEMNGGGGN